MKTKETLAVTQPDLVSAIRRLSKLADQEFPWNLIHLETQDTILKLSCFSKIGYATCGLKVGGDLELDTLCEISSLSDAIESFTKGQLNLYKEGKDLEIKGEGKRRVLVPTDFAHKFNIVRPKTKECQDVKLNDEFPFTKVDRLKFLGAKTSVDGVYLSNGEMLITNVSGTSFIYDSECGINLGKIDGKPIEVMIPRAFIALVSSLEKVSSVSVGQGRILFKHDNEEVCLPLCTSDTTAGMAKRIKVVKKIAELGDEEAVTISPKNSSFLKAEIDAAAKSSSSLTVDPSIDLIITKNKINMRLFSPGTNRLRFEGETECTASYRDTESSEFGINVRSFAGILKEASNTKDPILRVYRKGPAIFHTKIGSVHMGLGMEKSSDGTRKQV